MFIRQALSDYSRGNSASLKNKVIILLLKNFVTDTGFLSHRCRRYPHLNLKTWTLETTLTNLQNGAKTLKKTQIIPNKNNSLDKTISDFSFHSDTKLLILLYNWSVTGNEIYAIYLNRVADIIGSYAIMEVRWRPLTFPVYQTAPTGRTWLGVHQARGASNCQWGVCHLDKDQSLTVDFRSCVSA